MPDFSSHAPGHLLIVNWPVHLPGGVNEAVLGLTSQLQKHGIPPVIAVAAWTPEPQPLETRGIEVVGLRLREPFLPGFLLTLPSDGRALWALLRARNIQVVNAHFPSLNIALVMLLKALRLYRGKVVLTFHGADLTEASQSTGWMRKLWEALILRADAVVTPSEALRREVLAFAPQAHVTTIHNGADVALFSGITRPSERPLRRLLHIGKFEYKKSQDVILQAFKRLLAKYPDCSLMLIGADGPMLRQTRALLEELALTRHVELHVNVPHDQLPPYMERADLFLLPSRSEPFGIVLLEAGAAGLPVIASEVGGIPELIESERTGLLIPPGNVGALEMAITRLIEDPDLATELAHRWRQRVLTTWNWEITCEKYLQMIHGLK